MEWIPKPHLPWKHLEACLAPSRLRSQQVSEKGSFGGGGGEGVLSGSEPSMLCPRGPKEVSSSCSETSLAAVGNRAHSRHLSKVL